MTIEPRKPTLMYVCYGHGPWVDEITFSILSAQRYAIDDLQIVMVTDVPEVWRALPIAIEPIDPATMKAWSGAHDFAHRRKIMAMAHLLERCQAPIVYLDGDTYFTKSPARLFGRIGAGRSVMHMREGTLGIVQGQMHAALHAHLKSTKLRDAGGRELNISAESDMWNAGVVGLDLHEAPLLPEVLHLCDQLAGALRVSTLEQFAFSWTLGRHTQLSGVSDIIYHYWQPRLRAQFDQRARAHVQSTAEMPVPERSRELWQRRPRPSPVRRARNWVRDMLRWCGFFKNRLRGQG